MNRYARILSAAGMFLLLWTGARAQLAQQPLTVASQIPAAVMFALSVEFPTANTQAYSSAYSASSTYVGYFDTTKCYSYSTSNGYFSYAAATTSTNTCNGSYWSGNFLNWVSATGLDAFRYAMTGGSRIIDTTTNTVLQRTYQSGQGGTNNFPTKSITGSTLVKGATPLATGSTWYFRSQDMGIQMAYGTVQADVESNSTPSPCGGSHQPACDTTLAVVNVEVQVCVLANGLESNCQLYGTNIYKPVGTVQKNAGTMKFGVMSYFNDNSIDNAVLRAKMKFTGQYDYTTGSGVANTAQEWDPNTGIFLANPNPTDATNSYGGAVTQSGVVNYINLFGYHQKSYKTYDDIGKLYYEALSYLRHRAIDTGFYSLATSSNNDNLPFITTWDDPVQAYCQKNFIFLMGDSHTHCDKRLPGGSFTTYGPGECHNNPVDDDGSLSNGDTQLNVSTWTNNISSGLATAYTAGSGSGASYYMSGAAYWAHTNDVRTDLTKPPTQQTTVSTYIVDVQEYGDQNVNGQLWLAAKYGGFDTTAVTSGGAPLTAPTNTPLSNWAVYDSNYDGSETISSDGTQDGAASNDGSTAAGHGIRPSHYLPAGNPAAMIAAVNSAFSAIATEAGSNAATAQSGNSLATSTGVYLFQSTYNTNGWTGDVKAYPVTASATSSGALIGNPLWSASNLLTGVAPASPTPAPASRVILTFNDGVATYSSDQVQSVPLSRQGVSFSAIADLSTAQQLALNTSSAGTVDSQGVARISYFRGVRTGEVSNGGTFRNRLSLLGDIVNSSPAYIAAPGDFFLEPGFSTFALNNATRKPMIYVGANDGMLHAFNADPNDSNVGQEMLAYVPSPVYRNLSKLTDPAYTHQYYVDGSPFIGDACPASGGCTGTSSWKTILLGTLNAGGQGVFALDVTSPGTAGTSGNGFSAPSSGSASSTVLWEFTDENGDRDLGSTFGQPVIAKMNNGNWAAIFGNGYYNTTADGLASTTGQAALYIVFLSGPSGPNHTWISGTDFIKIIAGGSTGPGSTTGTPNGLGSPATIDADSNGTTDFVYAGDLYGNIWKFDLRSASPASWTTAFSGLPLFTAKDASGNAQPITGGITVLPSQFGGFQVFFGTGSFMTNTDAASTATQTLYGILDRNDGSTRIPSTFRTLNSVDSLQKQGYVFAGVTVDNTTVTVVSNCLVNYPGQNLNTTTSTNCPTGWGKARRPRRLRRRCSWAGISTCRAPASGWWPTRCRSSAVLPTSSPSRPVPWRAPAGSPVWSTPSTRIPAAPPASASST